LTEIVVCAGENAEIRSITLANHGQESCVMEITSYFEPVLSHHGADIAHPAFGNLFIRTEFLAEHNCLIAGRRPKIGKGKTCMDNEYRGFGRRRGRKPAV